MRVRSCSIWLALLALVGTSVPGGGDARAADLTVATFRVDVTPPLGDGPCVGFMPRVTSVEHPLELRGVVLRTTSATFVLAAIDYCGICNTSDDTLRDALAEAAGTTRDRVALQSLHQHSAPVLDADAVAMLHGEGSERHRAHLAFTAELARRARVEITRGRAQRVLKILASSARVDRVASNRRVPQHDGSIAVRASLTVDPAIREAPEGLIDPFVRTVTFRGESSPLAQLHFYATHPQTFYGDGRVSWDQVGMAREAHERDTGVFQLYFTGCGGNITVGKYNDGSRLARAEIARRLRTALTESSRRAETDPDRSVDTAALPAAEVAWKTAPLRFSVRTDGPFHPDALRSALEADRPASLRLTAASFTAFFNRLRGGHVCQANRLRLGEIDLVFLPGEPFVEFQLFAQRQAQGFVCVAGYGECGVWYYGPDQIYRDRGGYEQSWSVTGPCEESVHTALRELVR